MIFVVLQIHECLLKCHNYCVAYNMLQLLNWAFVSSEELWRLRRVQPRRITLAVIFIILQMNVQTSCFSCFKMVPTKHRRYKTSIVKLSVMFTAPALK